MGILSKIKDDIKNAGANKGKFIYFREGQKVRIRFLQDMEEAVEIPFHDNWERRINYPCQTVYGLECPGCDDDELRTRTFYIWSVYNYDENDVQLFMFAVNNCSPIPPLAGMYEEYGTLKDRDYIISVTGKGTSKAYSVVPGDKNKFRNKKVKPYSKQKVFEMVAKAYPFDDGDDDKDDQDESDNDYEDMRPRELYDLCKERKIEVVPRKPKQYYIKLLEEYDQQNDDWGDDDDDPDDYDSEWAGVDEPDDDFMNIPDDIDSELPFN